MSVPTLYHGTDARILRMSQDEIKAFKQDIFMALDYLWKFYEPYTMEHTHLEYNPVSGRSVCVQDVEYLKGPLGHDEGSDLYTQVVLAISVNNHRLEGKNAWQYDGLYLTNWEWQAWGYAKRAYSFGELGMIAQILIKGARKIGFNNWNPDAGTISAMDRIIGFSEGKAEPVIIILDNLDISHIKDESGNYLREGSQSRVFMYDKQIDLNDYPRIYSEPSSDSMTHMLEYKNGTLTLSQW